MFINIQSIPGAIQERIRSTGSPTAINMMVSLNGWSSIFLCIYVVATGELLEFYKFASQFPNVLTQLLVLSVSSAVGQVFIFIMVKTRNNLFKYPK